MVLVGSTVQMFPHWCQEKSSPGPLTDTGWNNTGLSCLQKKSRAAQQGLLNSHSPTIHCPSYSFFFASQFILFTIFITFSIRKKLAPNSSFSSAVSFAASITLRSICLQHIYYFLVVMQGTYTVLQTSFQDTGDLSNLCFLNVSLVPPPIICEIGFLTYLLLIFF